MSITVWTVIAVIAAVALLVIIKLVILAFMMNKRYDEEETKTHAAEELRDHLTQKSGRERRE